MRSGTAQYTSDVLFFRHPEHQLYNDVQYGYIIKNLAIHTLVLYKSYNI